MKIINLILLITFFFGCALTKKEVNPIEIVNTNMRSSCDLDTFNKHFKFDHKDDSRAYYFTIGTKLEMLIVESADGKNVSFAQILLIYNNQYDLAKTLALFDKNNFKISSVKESKGDFLSKVNTLVDNKNSMQIEYEEYGNLVNTIVWKKCLK